MWIRTVQWSLPRIQPLLRRYRNQSMNRKYRKQMSVSVPTQSRTLPLSWKHSLSCIRQLLAYYVKNGVLAPVSGDYVFSELVNPVFTKDGDNLKVSVSVKYLDNKSKMTQISQYELVLHKDDNWKIVE